MKKVWVVLMTVVLGFSVALAQGKSTSTKPNAKQLVSASYQKTLADITYSNFDLYKNDAVFKNKLRPILSKVGLSVNDFDMGEALAATNMFDQRYLVTNFWQKNNYHKDKQFSIYIAYDTQKNLMMVVLTEDNQHATILGDKNKTLIQKMLAYGELPAELVSSLLK